MFFVSHKRDGVQVGKNLQRHLCAALAKAINKSHPDIKLPDDFFDDEYTFFFSFAFVEFTMTNQFSGKDWSSAKKFEFREAALNAADRAGYLHSQFVARAKTAVEWATIDEDKTRRTKSQNLAIDDAWAMAGILYGFASQDDSHIHIKSTKMIIESLSAKKQHNTTRSSHALLIAHQTIGRRIKERYVK